jgi:BirA family transcriptional regulator, biotin operon repressor / biotin---[acetyl-CoA-carboxylase] ligase
VHLAQRSVDEDYRLEIFERLGSTNDVAMARAETAGLDKLWVVANRQDAGRGRHGRDWASPPGNLYASLVLIDPAAPEAAAQLGFVAGVALGNALRRLVPASPPIELKWPNDALWRGAKLSGLIVEGIRLKSGDFACILGIGVNCATHPADVLKPTTDLTEIAQRPVSAAEVFRELTDELPLALRRWRRGHGFDQIRAEWLSLAGGVGEKVRADTGARIYEGRFRTIDRSGRLVLDCSVGAVTIAAGEVFLAEFDTASEPPITGELATDET